MVTIQVDIERADLRFLLDFLGHTNSDPAGHGNSTPLNTNEYDWPSAIGFEDLTGHPVQCVIHFAGFHELVVQLQRHGGPDRKSTRLNSSHANISYAVFCLKKKKLIE